MIDVDRRHLVHGHESERGCRENFCEQLKFLNRRPGYLDIGARKLFLTHRIDAKLRIAPENCSCDGEYDRSRQKKTLQDNACRRSVPIKRQANTAVNLRLSAKRNESRLLGYASRCSTSAMQTKIETAGSNALGLGKENIAQRNESRETTAIGKGAQRINPRAFP